MKKYNILITTTGGIEKTELVIRLAKEKYVGNLIAVDCSESTTTNFISSISNVKFYKVPKSTHKSYVGELAKIVEAEKVDLIIPIDNLEIIKLRSSKLKSIKNVKILANSVLKEAMCTKSYQIEELGEEYGGIYDLLFSSPSTSVSLIKFDEFCNLIHKQGYKAVVIKPNNTNGSRGLRVCKFDYNYNDYSMNKTAYTCSIDEGSNVISNFHKSGSNDELILQPYYGGQNYNVECYVDTKGDLKVATFSIEGDRWGQVKGATIINHPEVNKIAKEIANKFEFDSFFNFEVSTNHKGQLKLVEVNPRVSAVSVQLLGTPNDILSYAIKDLLGIKQTTDLNPNISTKVQSYFLTVTNKTN